MRPRLKPLRDQVVVITGASSGIGLATAYAFAAKGARLVLAARNGVALDRVAAELRSQGADVLAIVTDVADRTAVDALADAAIAAYGGFDTWVNNAGVGLYGRLDQVTEEEHRRLFDVNYWGLVHGSLVAVQHLRLRGGALINLGSVLSEVSVPLQGTYCASKAAVRGFTDALRHEVRSEGAPVAVCLIKPAAIDTPFPQHARNHLDREPKLPPPLYPPEAVAEAILHAARHGGRDYPVGNAAPPILAAGRLVPGLMDWATSLVGPAVQKRAGPPGRPVEGNLFAPSEDGGLYGAPPQQGPVRPVPLGALGLLLLVGAASVLGRRS